MTQGFIHLGEHHLGKAHHIFIDLQQWIRPSLQPALSEARFAA